jgi:predicted dehydrogenase
MKRKIRICISGAGVFGGHHAAKLAHHPRIEFAGVYDPEHPERAQKLVDAHGGQVFATREAMIAAADALIVASPASVHFRQAMDALEQGLHVLVEKPLATRLEDAREMVAMAEKKDVILQVGHQERFVSNAIGLFDIPEQPLHIEASRVAPYSIRGTDVSVTLDLMTHDLDLVNLLTGSEADEVRSDVSKGPSGGIDDARAVITYPGGTRANIHASRTAPSRQRHMRIEYPSGVVEIDFVNRLLVNGTPFALNEDFADTPEARDCLGAEVNAFVRAILDGEQVPVCGIAGSRALALALRVDKVA